jgi:CelD/BcsL family acetyltransferase involved in cellulose biosynthesis
MRVEVVRGPLPASLIGRWLDITNRSPWLSSPFFRPEFTQAVASARHDTCVASINDGEALYPFQPRPLGIAEPLGSPLSDYHGVIAEPGASFDLPELLQRCELRAWSFNHVPADQTCFTPWSFRTADSPILDLALDTSHLPQGNVGDLGRKRRKAERALGAIEFEMNSHDPEMLAWCIERKSEQYEKNNSPDIFTWGWPRRVLETLAGYRSEPQFSAMLSVLRMGGKVVAAHFGLRSRHVLHWWFPTYDLAYGQFSPGIHLLLEVIAAAPAHGISVIDFGRGDTRYKQDFANRSVRLLEGCVSNAAWISALYRQRARLVQLAHRRLATESNPLYRTLRRAYWTIRP